FGVPLSDELLGAVAARHHLQGNHVEWLPILKRTEVVGEAESLAVRLAREIEAADLPRAVRRIEDHYSVALTAGRKVPIHRLRPQPPLRTCLARVALQSGLELLRQHPLPLLPLQ